MIGELDGLGPDEKHGGGAGEGGSFAFPPMEFIARSAQRKSRYPKHAGSMALDIARGVRPRLTN
jgi:hypothetical protein